MKTGKIKKRHIIVLLLAILLAVAFYPSPDSEPIRYVDRQTGELKTEKVPGENWLVWLYNNPIGEATLATLVKRKFTSSLYGRMMDKPASKEKIQPFVEEYGIDLSIAEKQEFTSFNDFFTRKLKKSARPINNDSNVVVSPADGKLMAWDNVSNSDFIIKGFRFDVASFLDDSLLARNYNNGSLIVVRLAPDDYHRFHFPVNGIVSPVVEIKGDYYSVNPIALHQMIEIFCLNKRQHTIITTAQFGDVVMVEVGATMVGSIMQTHEGHLAEKGEEKGYFKFGGSTVVLLFEKGKIGIDNDLLANTGKGLETSVLTGEQIGVAVE